MPKITFVPDDDIEEIFESFERLNKKTNTLSTRYDFITGKSRPRGWYRNHHRERRRIKEEGMKGGACDA